MAKDRECVICGKKYKYCPSCKEYNSDEKWRMIYCSDDCRNIKHIVDEYRSGTIDRDEAKKKMLNYNVPAINSIKEWARDYVSEIMKTPAKKRKTKITVKNDI